MVAFNSSSFFSTVELPNMRAGVVTHVVALIVHDKGSGMYDGFEKKEIVYFHQ